MQQNDDDDNNNNNNNNNNNFTAHPKPTSKKNNSPFEEFTDQYAKIGKKPAVRKSKIGGEGEIIQVPGGHIIRATGGKDRHSKVYTSKGPRDRRVRLSANTAIQFYDVQDRLGYDRPSKAVDWLMNKAKEAIDKLEDDLPNHKEVNKMDHHSPNDFNPGSKSVQDMDLEQQQETANIRYAFQLQRHLGGELNANSGIMATPPATQSMADSMKSFFPLNPGTSLMEMQSYPHDRISRIGIQSEDLGLLLQTQNQNQRAHTADHELLLHQGSNSVAYHDQSYSKPPESSWNNLGVQEENRVGFTFNPNAISQQIFSSQNSSEAISHQREPLQSNYSQLLHSWNERMLPSVDQQQNVQPTIQPCSYNLYFGSNFQVPPQIHGEEEQEEHSHCSQR